MRVCIFDCQLYPKRKHRHDYDDDEYDYSDEDSSSTDDEGLPPTTIFPLPFSLPFGFSPFAYVYVFSASF